MAINVVFPGVADCPYDFEKQFLVARALSFIGTLENHGSLVIDGLTMASLEDSCIDENQDTWVPVVLSGYGADWNETPKFAVVGNGQTLDIGIEAWYGENLTAAVRAKQYTRSGVRLPCVNQKDFLVRISRTPQGVACELASQGYRMTYFLGGIKEDPIDHGSTFARYGMYIAGKTPTGTVNAFHFPRFINLDDTVA